MIQREYVYHNQIKGQNTEIVKKKDETDRTVQAPIESIDPNGYDLQVDMKNYK
jgi:hypothetical protein